VEEVIPQDSHQDNRAASGAAVKQRSVYRDLFCKLPAAVFLLDSSTLAILDCSDQARNLFAHDSFELTGTSFLQLHAPSDAEIARENLRAGITSYSTLMVDTAGRGLSAEITATPVDCDGTACLIVCADATRASTPSIVEHAELQLLSTQVPVVLWSTNPELKFLSMSGSAVRNRENVREMVGSSLYDFLKTKDPEVPAIRAHLQALRGESVSYDYQHGDSSYHCWLEPLRTPNGVQGVIGVAIDVTEQRRIEAQLRASEERNRAIIENATDVIYTHDLRGNFTSISPAAETLGGYKPEDMVGMNISQVIAPEFLESSLDHIRRKLAGEQINAFELELLHKNGSRIPVEVSTRLIFRDGAPIGIQGIARDLRDRRMAERALRDSESRFRAVAETAASAIFICLHDKFAYVNSASEAITGYSADELCTKKFWEIVHPDFQDLVRVRGTARIAGDTVSPNRYEFKIVRKDGEERWVDFTAGVIEYNDQNALLGTAFDITERKRAEQELQIQKKQLEELFQTAPEGIVILDSLGKVLQANDEFLSMFDFEILDVLGEEIDKFIVPANKREEAAALNVSMNKGYAAVEQTRRTRKDGTLIDVSILAKPLTVSQGQVGRFVIYRDITAHRRAEHVREVQFSTTQVLSGAVSLDDATERLLPSLAKELGWEYARMWIVDGSLHCVRSWHAQDLQPLEHFATPAATSEAVRTVINSGESLWVADLKEIALWPHSVVDQSGIHSIFAFAIRISSGIYGVLEFASTNPRQPDFELLKVMNDIGAQVGQFVERKNAERAVVESESKFRAVADTAASAIFILGADRLLYVNQWTEKITGYSRAEMLEMDVWRIVHPDDVTALRDRLRRRFAGDQELRNSFEFRILTRNGGSRWLEYSASPIGFEGQMAILATAFDITERKRAEQLQSALYRITSLASNTTDLSEVYRGIHEIVGELMYARNFYIAVLDSTSNVIEFPYFVDEEDPEPPPPQLRSRGLTDYVLRTGKPLFADPKRFQEMVDAGDVESRGAPSLDWLGVPLKSGEQTFGVLTVQSYSESVRYGTAERDILTFVSQQVARAIENRRNQDALQQSEARYRSQVQSALYGLYRSTIDGRFLDVNPALVQMLGYETAEEMFSLDMARDLYVDSEERARIIREVGDNDVIQGVEAHWRRNDGKVIVVRLSGRRAVPNPKEPVSYEMIAEDITERRQLEDQLRHSQKMEAVGRLAGGIAHDFNNLLTVIKGYSDLMLSEVRPGERMRNEVEEIRKAADRAAALTRQLLAFSRRQVLEPRVLDLNSVVNNMDRLLRRLIGDDVEFYTALEPQLGTVKADPGQIEQVIMNLAVNARDAMPTGGRLTVETANVELDEAYARENGLAHGGIFAMLAVTDNGIGMSAETRSQIFEPFFTTKELGKGTGLGLSTVYGIVKQSGGHINCYSEIGKGTTFKVYLPTVASGRTMSSEFTPQPRLSATPRKATETVLLVEDEDGVRALIRQVLERDGYRVLEARNGSEAMLTSEKYAEKIDLLLTDVVLAQMSGRDVAKVVMEKRKDAKVLFISGYTEEAIVGNGVLETGTAFLQKPFTPSALSRKLREILDVDPRSLAATNSSQ
jgi:two-component system cell cycle sensor histidine kinase/response regulator CckA